MPDRDARAIQRTGVRAVVRRTYHSVIRHRVVDAAAVVCPGCGVMQADMAGAVGLAAGRSEKRILVAFLLCFFVGVFGVHRMYQGKWITGILYLFTGGLFFIGVLYDFWTLNTQISERNRARV